MYIRFLKYVYNYFFLRNIHEFSQMTKSSNFTFVAPVCIAEDYLRQIVSDFINNRHLYKENIALKSYIISYHTNLFSYIFFHVTLNVLGMNISSNYVNSCYCIKSHVLFLNEIFQILIHDNIMHAPKFGTIKVTTRSETVPYELKAETVSFHFVKKKCLFHFRYGPRNSVVIKKGIQCSQELFFKFLD